MRWLIPLLLVAWPWYGDAKKKCGSVTACVESCRLVPPGKFVRCLSDGFNALSTGALLDGRNYQGEPAALQEHVRASTISFVVQRTRGAEPADLNRVAELWKDLGPTNPQVMALGYGLATSRHGRKILLDTVAAGGPMAGFAACAALGNDNTGQKLLTSEQRKLSAVHVWKRYLTERKQAFGTGSQVASGVMLSFPDLFRDRLATLLRSSAQAGAINDWDAQLALNFGHQSPRWGAALLAEWLDDPRAHVREPATRAVWQLYNSTTAKQLGPHRGAVEKSIRDALIHGTALAHGNNLALAARVLYDVSSDPKVLDAMLDHLDHDEQQVRINAAEFLAPRVGKDPRIAPAVTRFVTMAKNPGELTGVIGALPSGRKQRGSRDVLGGFLLGLDKQQLASTDWHGVIARAANGYQAVTGAKLGLSAAQPQGRGVCGNSYFPVMEEMRGYELLGLEVPQEIHDRRAAIAGSEPPDPAAVTRELQRAVERVRKRER